MLQSDYLAIAEATNEAQLHAQALRLTKKLGFQTFSIIVALDKQDGECDFCGVDNTPVEYEDVFNDLDIARRNPVSQHCRFSNRPIAWDQTTYVEANEGGLWENQARFGYRAGVAVAHHLRDRKHLLVGFDLDAALPPPDSVARHHLISEVQMFATYALEPALRLIVPSKGEVDAIPLSRRELEVLSWTMEGKTAWEIGRILGISENTVAHHAHRASDKLECTSKHHAVVKALRLGLIG